MFIFLDFGFLWCRLSVIWLILVYFCSNVIMSFLVWLLCWMFEVMGWCEVCWFFFGKRRLR